MKKQFIKPNCWTEEEINYLKSNYNVEKMKEISAHLKRTEIATRQMSKKLGLWKPKRTSDLRERTSKKHFKGGEYLTGSEFGAVRRNAKIRNVLFDITVEDVEEVFKKQDFKCKFTKIDLFFNSTKLNGGGVIASGNASIDRKDNTKGYTKDNIQILHKDINRMKWDLEYEEFIRLCKLVVENNEL
jgi:hypothetical protein